MAQQNSSEEVDLGYLLKKSNDIFKGFARAILKIIDFFKKHFIILIVIILIGFGFGLYKDYNEVKSYNNELIVIPNFGSVDYLYDKVEALNSKIASKDTIYLKQILGANYSKLNLIEIEPIVDLYNFISEISSKYRYFENYFTKSGFFRICGKLGHKQILQIS